MKPVVHYHARTLSPVNGTMKVGESVYLSPLDHPNENLNNQPVITSSIVSFSPNGEFETLNTIYRPVWVD